MLRLGLIGLSEGNGHPYSWAAIFNGYEREAMEDCGFPTIPRYLERRRWPEDTIGEAKVTHVWTQDQARSRHISKACRIPGVVARAEDMLGHVDGLLLARDDAETHYPLARPFLEAGLPVYIDKPIALSCAELDRIYALQCRPGQIFTCSALRYASEFSLSAAERTAIGVIEEIHATTPKDWDKYSIHVIEPMLDLYEKDLGELVEHSASHGEGGATALTIRWESGAVTRISALGAKAKSPISLRLMGEKGCRDLVFSDSFTAFRAALRDFVQGILNNDVRSDPGFVRRVIRLVELGRIQ